MAKNFGTKTGKKYKEKNGQGKLKRKCQLSTKTRKNNER